MKPTLDKKLKNTTNFGELLDIPLFLIGFFIPFTGDIFESLIGGIIDIILFKRYYKRFGENSIYILLIESIDLTDFATMGMLDILGWIEMIPFWLIFFSKSNKKIDLPKETSHSHLSSPKSDDKDEEINEKKHPKKAQNQCNECGKVNPPNLSLCEKCGSILK